MLPDSQTAIDLFLDALWLEDGLSRNTLAAYRRDLTLYAQWLAGQQPPLALDDTAEHHLQGYFAARHAQTRATSANRRLTVLRRYFHWALRERRIEADPTVRLQAARQPLRVPKTLTQAQVEALLHAPDDATRSKIMPANHGRGVAALIDACARYYEATGRRISFEYAMIDGVNDTPEHARLLAKHARRVCAHVNLIPLNHVEERAFRPSTPEHLKAFIRILERAGVNVTVRRKLGSDVDASCGQLRKKVADHRA